MRGNSSTQLRPVGHLDEDAFWEQLRHAALERSQETELDALLSQGMVFCGALDLATPLSLVAGLLGEEEFTALLTLGVDRSDLLARLLDLLLTLSLRDPLTHLYNRRHFDHRLMQELRRAEREEQSCSLLMIDLDDFKGVNDNQGHEAGDAMLCCVADTLLASLRVSDEVARLGGDEFAAILPGTGQRLAVECVAPRLLRDLGRECSVNLSMGVATFDTHDPIAADELMRRADQALYAAKAAGKNTVRGYEATAKSTSLEPDEREALLR